MAEAEDRTMNDGDIDKVLELARAINTICDGHEIRHVVMAIAAMGSAAIKNVHEAAEGKETLKEVFESFVAGMRAMVFADEPMAGEDYQVVVVPEAQAKMDDNPKLAAFVRDTIARARQALDGAPPDEIGERLAAAGFKRMAAADDDTLEAMGFKLPNLDDEDDDD